MWRAVRDCAVQCVYTCYTVLHSPRASTTSTLSPLAVSVSTQHSTATTTTPVSVSRSTVSPYSQCPPAQYRPQCSAVRSWRVTSTYCASLQSSLDIQLVGNCHLAFNNYCQLCHNKTSVASTVNFVKINPDHLFDPNTL